MNIKWIYSQEEIDWHELSDLYRVAPLGNKESGDLKKEFTNSIFKCLLFDNIKLVAVGRALADGAGCSYICGVALLPDYQGSGPGKKNYFKAGRTIQRSQKKYFIFVTRKRSIL